MGTLTLTNTGETYTTLSSLMSAVDGIDYGTPAIAELSGVCELAVGINTRIFPNGLIVRAASGEEFTGVVGQGGARLVTSQVGGNVLESRSPSLIRFEHIELETLGANCAEFFVVDEYNRINLELSGCYVAAVGGATDSSFGRAVHLRSSDFVTQRIFAVNTVFYTKGGFVFPEDVTGTTQASVEFDKCTMYRCNNRNQSQSGVNAHNEILKITNSYIYNGAPLPCISGALSDLSYIATSDATSYGIGALDNVPREDVLVNPGVDFNQLITSPLLTAASDGGAIGYNSVVSGGADTTAPVITLNAPASIDIVEGGTYTVAAATASDDTDVAITVNVAGDTVDVNTVGAYVVTFNATDAAGNAATQVTQTVNITAAPAVVPQGIVTIGTITKTDTTASISLTYSLADQTGFEYRIDGGAATTGASPIPLSGLTQSTAYTIEVRAVNAVGAGNWSAAANFTTDATVLRGVLGSLIPANSAIDTSDITIDPSKYYYAVVQLPEPHGLVFTEDGSNFRWIDIQNALNDSFVTNDVYSFDIEIFENEISLGIKTVDVTITA